MEGVNEGEEEEVRSESGWSKMGSRASTPSSDTSRSNSADTTSMASDLDAMDWANDESLDLTSLEELRGDFETELKDPSAWTLQRVMVLSEAGSESAARRIIKLWLDKVSWLTKTPPGDQLQLAPLRPPRPRPFYRVLTWDEADELVGEERERVFGRNVAESQKDLARASIEFLFPEARSEGLSVNDKRKIFTVASYVSMHFKPKALGLMWVLDKEYPNIREDTQYVVAGSEPDWANEMSKEFMIYTVLSNPPIMIHRLP
jgi:hypothetical protein